MIRKTSELQKPAEHWRMFVAVPVPEIVKDALEKIRAELRELFRESVVGWTRREQIHVTLKFLGDVESTRATELITELGRECRGLPPLQLRVERLGAFPNIESPRVLWLAVTDTRGQLFPLQRRVEAAARNFSSKSEALRFTGHITLGRCRRILREDSARFSLLVREMSNQVFGEWTADRVELIRSDPSSQSCRYSLIGAVCLKGNG